MKDNLKESLTASMEFLGRPCRLFDIELTNRCAVRCPRCPRTLKPLTSDKRDLDLDFFKFAFPQRLSSTLKRPMFLFEGNYGDCIYNPELLEILEYLKITFNAEIKITTNGSGRKKDFWNKLVTILDDGDLLQFSIDGLEDTNHLYRVGASWPSIELALKETCGKVPTRWKFIYFSHNEHQLERVKKYSDKIGVDDFMAVKSKRFRPKNLHKDNLMPSDLNLISRTSDNRSAIKKIINNEDFEKLKNDVDLRPHCFKKGNSYLFISSDGFISPCCATGLYHERVPAYPFISEKDLLDLGNLRLRPIDESLMDQRWGLFNGLNERNLQQSNLCYRRCGVLKGESKLKVGENPSYLKDDRTILDF